MKTKMILLGFFILTIGLFSCKKDEIDTNPIPDRPASMSELTANPGFSWQTVRNVKVKLQGSHIMTATIKNANGDVYFKGMVKPNAKVETAIDIPASVKEIVVTYGPFSKTVTITNNSIDCTFDLNSF